MRWRTIYLETAAWEMEMLSFASSPCRIREQQTPGERKELSTTKKEDIFKTLVCKPW